MSKPRDDSEPPDSLGANEAREPKVSEQGAWIATAASGGRGKVYEHCFTAFGKPVEWEWASALLVLVEHGEGYGPEDYGKMPARDRLKARGFDIKIKPLDVDALDEPPARPRRR